MDQGWRWYGSGMRVVWIRGGRGGGAMEWLSIRGGEGMDLGWR